MTTTTERIEIQTPEYLRTDREAMIRVLALAYNELDPRLRKYEPHLVNGYVLAVITELDCWGDPGMVAVERLFLAYADAVAERASFMDDGREWLAAKDLPQSSWDGFDATTAHEVAVAQAALLAVAVNR